MKNLLLTLVFVSTTFLSAQNSEWLNFSNGKFVKSIAFEGNFVWVGTTVGLVKINKITRETIFYDKTNSGLPSNYVKAIAIDNMGVKWIGTKDGGLAKFDGVNWTVYYTSNSGLPTNDVQEITIDNEGNIWIGTSPVWDGQQEIGGGLAKFDGVNWTVYNTSSSGIPSNNVYAIEIDNEENLWIGTLPIWDGQQYVGGGMAKFDGVNWTVYNTSNSGLPMDWVRAIAIDNLGTKWIGTWYGGLAKFDGMNWTIYDPSNSGLPNRHVQEIEIDNEGNKWIGTRDGGLAKFDGVNWTVYNTSNSGLTFNYIDALVIDNRGNKWIGTLGGGLVKFDGVNWTVFNTSNSGLPSNDVRVISTDNAGNIWIGTSPTRIEQEYVGGGLAKFDGVNWTVYNTSNSGLPSNDVREISIDNKGNKWIGTSGGGLVKFDGLNWTVYNDSNSGLPTNNVNTIVIDSLGNKWIGTDDWGLAKFDGVRWTDYDRFNSELPSNHVYAIAIDSLNNKWIGTDGGLAKFDGVNWTIYNISNSGLPSDNVYAIEIDNAGNLWIGTNPYWLNWQRVGGGLAKFDGVNWTIYNTSNSGLPTNFIFSITIDSAGNKWICTDRGIAKFDDINWTIYNNSNSGLPNRNVTAMAIDKSGNKWIGTFGGGIAVYREGGVINVYKQLLTEFILSHNYPNPFNSTTKIKYSIPNESNVTITIYDILGREITTFVNEKKSAGSYEIEFNASNLSSGVYLYRMLSGSYSETKKMVLIR